MNETKIYLVKFKNYPKIIYIGNTHTNLNKRLQAHHYHKSTLNKYVEKNNINWNDVYIELYEIFKYNKRDEYENREAEVIKEFLDNNEYIVLNLCKTGINQTCKIIDEVNKYLIQNIKKIIEDNINNYNSQINQIKNEIKNEKKYDKRNTYAREYYQKNREKKIEKQKEYQKNNYEKIKEYKKNYYNKK